MSKQTRRERRLAQRRAAAVVSLADAREERDTALADAAGAVTPRIMTSGGPLAELGVSGTVNTDGRIRYESNADLRDELARGRPGIGTTWGWWERIVRTDPACQTALHVVTASLRDAEVGVEPVEGLRDAEKHADYLRDNLTKWMDPTWAGLVEEVVPTFLSHGFDIHEPVMGTRPDARVPGGVGVYVRKLAQRLPSSLAPNPWVERDGELKEVIQSGHIWVNGQQQWQQRISLPAERILLWTWQRNGSNYQGFSAFRSVWYIVKLREALLKIFAIGSEREALGVPIASVDKDAKLDKARVEELQTFLENITAHEHAAAVAPAGVTMEWVFSPGANKGHVIDAWQKLGTTILETFLSQQVSLGTHDTGSRAVGEVHDATKNDFIGGVKAVFEAVLNGVGERPYTGLARRILEPNFGPIPAYPRINLILKRRNVSAGELATQLPAMKDAGMITWRLQDENAWREKVGLEPVTPEEWEAEQARKAVVASPGPFGDGRPEPQVLADSAPVLKLASGRSLSLKRPLFAWERHLALAEMADLIDGGRDELAAKMGAAVAAAVRAAKPSIISAMKDGRLTPDEVDIDLSRLGSIITSSAEYARAEGYRHVASERASQAKARALVEKRAEGQAALASRERVLRLEEEDDKGDGAAAPLIAPSEDLVTPSRPPASTAELEARASRMIAAMRDRLIRRVRSSVIADIEREALYVIRKGGGDVASVVDRVASAALEGRGLKFDAGSVQVNAFAMGREQFVQEHGAEVRTMRYSAILDGKTCLPCNQADGLEFALNSPEHDAHTPPYRECKGGDLCRCLLVAEFDTGNDDGGGFSTVEEAP